MESHIGKGVGKYIEAELFTAKEYVLISSPDVSPSLGQKLFEMAKRGIKVRVITSNTGGAGSDKTNLQARELVKPPTDEHELSMWKVPSLEYRIVSTKEVALIHAKIFVIDGKCAIFGSANLTENSFWNFVEYIHITRNIEEVKNIEKDFEEIYNSYHDIKLDIGTKKEVKGIIKKVRRKLF